MLKSLLIIFGFSWIGELIASNIPFPIPGSIIGFIILFFSLKFGLVRSESIEKTSTSLQKNMAFLFVPLVVGLMSKGDVIKDYGVKLFFIILLTTIVTYVCVGKLADWVIDHE